MPRVVLVANPAAGGGLDPEELARRLAALGAEVVDDDPKRVVVAGGDGTVGPAAAKAAELGVPLAVVPAGTANDFARDQGLPLDVEAALRLAVTGQRTRWLELARWDGGPFVNVAAAGLSPVAGERARPLKPRLGPLAYPVAAAAAALRTPPLPCCAAVDGPRVFAGHAWQVMVAATGAFGGGSDIAVADPQDGNLDLTVIPAGPRVGLARRAWGMRRGTIAEQRGVVHRRGAVVELELPAGTHLNVDGEVMPTPSPRLRFTAQRDAFALVVP